MEWTNGIGSDEALEDGGVEAMWDSAAWPDVGVGNDTGSELELMFVITPYTRQQSDKTTE
jgi:hypothetical protein